MYITKLARQKLAERTQLAKTDQDDKSSPAGDVAPTTGSVASFLLIASVALAIALFANTRRASIADYVEGLVGGASTAEDL